MIYNLLTKFKIFTPPLHSLPPRRVTHSGNENTSCSTHQRTQHKVGKYIQSTNDIPCHNLRKYLFKLVCYDVKSYTFCAPVLLLLLVPPTTVDKPPPGGGGYDMGRDAWAAVPPPNQATTTVFISSEPINLKLIQTACLAVALRAGWMECVPEEEACSPQRNAPWDVEPSSPVYLFGFSLTYFAYLQIENK